MLTVVPDPSDRDQTDQSRSGSSLISARDRWCAVNAPHLVAFVCPGARFERGVLLERDEVTAA